MFPSIKPLGSCLVPVHCFFVPMAASVPDARAPVEMPLKGLRKATILFRWQKLVGLAMDFMAEYHQRDESNSTINTYSRPQAHALGSCSSTLEPVTNHDDAMFDDIHPEGYWQENVRVENWPEVQQEPDEDFAVFFAEFMILFFFEE